MCTHSLLCCESLDHYYIVYPLEILAAMPEDGDAASLSHLGEGGGV